VKVTEDILNIFCNNVLDREGGVGGGSHDSSLKEAVGHELDE
jgi:hypothetical protein